MNNLWVGRRAMMTVAGIVALDVRSASPQVPPPVLNQTSSLARPTRTPLLTISGKLRIRPAGGIAFFNRDMLEALGTATITTHTPWHDNAVRFDGVPMTRVMEAVEAEGQVVTATALNDYSIEIPIADFERFGVLLATRQDGVPLHVGDFGPFFIVYPYDSRAELHSSLYYRRSVWSLAQLVVR